MTYTINQDFMDTLEKMIECYDSLSDYYPEDGRYLATWSTLRDMKHMIEDPEYMEQKKQIFLNK